MKLFSRILGIVFVFMLAISNIGAIDFSDIPYTASIAKFDKNNIYTNDFFNFKFELPSTVKLINDPSDSYYKYLFQRSCKNMGNITDETEILFSVQSKEYDLYTGFEAIVTVEDSNGKNSKNILEEKIENFCKYNGDSSSDKGYFKQFLAGNEYEVGWSRWLGNTCGFDKVYVCVKEEKALIIYITHGDSDEMFDKIWTDNPCPWGEDYEKDYYNNDSDKWWKYYNVLNEKKAKRLWKKFDGDFFKGFSELELKEQIFVNYTVQQGDSLWDIAEEFYNDGFKYEKIKKFNTLKTDTLQAGQTLKIPN